MSHYSDITGEGKLKPRRLEEGPRPVGNPREDRRRLEILEDILFTCRHRVKICDRCFDGGSAWCASMCERCKEEGRGCRG